MKNKSITYLLIGVVILVWGTVLYRVISGSSSEDEYTPPVSSISSSRKKMAEKEDTFELIAAYRDPFLGKTPSSGSSGNSSSKSNHNRNKVSKTTLLPPPPPIDWSFVSYHGTIRNKQLNREIGIFRVNGNESMLSASERIGDVTILKITKDSAVILYQKVKKVLGKSY